MSDKDDDFKAGQVCSVRIDRRQTCDGGRYYKTPWGLMPTPKKEIENTVWGIAESLYKDDKKAKLKWLNERYKDEH